jgi:adenylate cyclase
MYPLAVGGQILVLESGHSEAGPILRIDSQWDVFPKGSETPLRIYEVGGIAGTYNLVLEGDSSNRISLAHQIPLQYSLLEKKDAADKSQKGFIAALLKKAAEIVKEESLEVYSYLKMSLAGANKKLPTKHFYSKAIQQSEKNNKTYVARFTMLPPEVDANFQALRQLVVKSDPV